MWGNLAGRLGANDFNSTLQKIGNAVAPPPGEYEYDDEEDYEEYDDEYEEESGEESEEGGGFGLVGMLSRALDDHQGNDDMEEHEDENEETVDFKGDVSSEKAVSMNTTMATTFEPVQTSTVDVRDYQIPAVPAKSLTNSTMKRKDNPLRGSERIRQGTENETTLQTQNAVSDKSIQLETPQIDAKPEAEKPKPSATSVAKQTVVEKPVRTGNTDSKQATDMLRRPVPPPFKVNEAPGAALPKGAVVTKAANPSVPKKKQPEKEMEKRQIDQRKPSSRTNSTEISKGPQLPPPVVQPPLTKIPDAEDKRNPKNETVSAGKETQRIEATVQQQSQSDQKRRGIDGEANLTSDGTNIEKSVALGGLRTEHKKLLEELAKAKEQISELQQRTSLNEQQSDSTREQLLINFHEKEARLLQATTEEHQQELLRMEQKMQSEIHSKTEQLARDRKQFVQQQENYRVTIDQSQSRAEQAENELKKYQKKQENQFTQSQQREERSIRMAEDKVAQTMAMLDERDEQLSNLKKVIRDLESKMNENQEGAEEAEEEVEELQTENESLQELIDTLEHECKGLKAHVAELETDGEKLGGMQMELTMLREERAREMAKNQNVVQSALHSNTKIESERDEALSELRDSKQQLAAALADLEIGKADIARITTGNNNLSHALEAFQDERHAEMELLDQQRKEAESAISCAHDAAMEALRQAHSAEMQQVQNAADLALKNKIGEMSFVEARIERLKSENNQTRRSLDEAIHRLQTSQEDVIDRALMKNILLDWCTRTSMSDKNKRHQVLELMANVLHFTDDEREKVHLTHMDIESVRSRVVGAFALPPSKADVEHLEGSNVGEKFLSFMLAETDDGF